MDITKGIMCFYTQVTLIRLLDVFMNMYLDSGVCGLEIMPDTCPSASSFSLSVPSAPFPVPPTRDLYAAESVKYNNCALTASIYYAALC